MLKKRIIPCLDLKCGRVVKGVNFVSLKDAGDPVEVAKAYNKEGADEIVFLDITASSDNRGIMIDVIKRASEELFIPLTVGGGIRRADDFEEILKAGADKISINTSAVLNPSLIKEAAKKFGNQCVVVAIDAKFDNADKSYHVFTHGGRRDTKIDAVAWAKRVEELGAGEILLTSMDKDGTKSGYELTLTSLISKAVKIPVIASGGAGSKEDFFDAFEEGNADACLAASLFHYKELEIKKLKEYLNGRGIPVRL